jgi:hypothetical protein
LLRQQLATKQFDRDYHVDPIRRHETGDDRHIYISLVLRSNSLTVSVSGRFDFNRSSEPIPQRWNRVSSSGPLELPLTYAIDWASRSIRLNLSTELMSRFAAPKLMATQTGALMKLVRVSSMTLPYFIN